MQAAYIGLLHVARNSDGEKGVKTYLFRRVIGAMVRHCQRFRIHRIQDQPVSS